MKIFGSDIQRAKICICYDQNKNKYLLTKFNKHLFCLHIKSENDYVDETVIDAYHAHNVLKSRYHYG